MVSDNYKEGNYTMDELNNLVFYHSISEPAYTTVDVIAEYAGIDRHQVMKVIRDHKNDLEEFGVLSYENPKPQKGSKGGRPRKDWQLNEQQVTFLFSLLDNTPQVVKFNKALIKAFYAVKEQVRKLEVANALQAEKMTALAKANKSLSEVVHDGWPNNPHMYATIHNLALKVVTGKNAKQLKTTFDVTDAKEALNSSQMERLERVKDLMKQLILNGYSYQEIKATVLKKRGAVNA